VADASSGPSVDSHGAPVIDPTKNVDALVAAAERRQDDLRTMESSHIRELIQRDREHGRELRIADKELRVAESDRLNAIRSVDTSSVQQTAKVVAEGAIALQTQVLATADAARASLESYKQAAAENLASVIKPLADAIAALQVQQNLFAGGKAQVVESRDVRGESRLNVSAVMGIIAALVGVASVFLVMIGIAVTIFVATRP
jgi:hypothetical protein